MAFASLSTLRPVSAEMLTVRRPGERLDVALDLAVQVAAALLVGQVPLVVGDDQRLAGLLDHRQDLAGPGR